MDLNKSIAVWSAPSYEQSNKINLESLSPESSAVIVNSPSYDFQGGTLKISEFNDLLPGKTRAFGTHHLRYVIILDEVQAGETLSEKWQVYYKRGWEVGKPAPVRYIHIDWHVTLVDLVSERIVTKAILSAEPPSDSRRPLSSKVEIRPSEDVLLQLLGYKK